MNIIIEDEQVEELRKKYTVLELDTLRILPENKLVTAYCIVENIPIPDLPQVESKRKLHQNLIKNYRKKDWNYCTQALEHLFGFWNHELDSFYDDLRSRIARFTLEDPGSDWDGIIEKHTT
jgi:hypothetical protein